MAKYINLIKTSFLFLLFIFLLSFTNKQNNNRVVDKIKFERGEENFIKNSILEKLINKYNPTEFGDKINQVDLSYIETKLDNHTFIKKSEVYFTPEGVIHAKIIEENPIIRIQTPIKSFYLTEDEKAINLSSLYAAEVILAQGDIKKEEYSAICNLVKYINDDNLLKNHIIGIKKEGRNFYTFNTNLGSSIEFGALVKTKEKFNALLLFYDQYLSKIPTGTYKKISIRFNNQIIASK